jgi:hypothetical protein
MGLMTGGGRPRARAPARERPGPGSVPPQPISLIVGFDDSESARRALAWGANLLRAGRGTLRVIYADRVLIASDLPGFARAGMDDARDEKAARVAAAAPFAVPGPHRLLTQPRFRSLRRTRHDVRCVRISA